MHPSRSIAIIGAGLTGTLLAIELLRRAEGRDRIHLFEKAPPFGRGVAYGTESPSHLLNVRAGEMSTFESKPQHFVAWLNSTASGDIAPLQRSLSPDAYVPRALYARYLQYCLQRALPKARQSHRLRAVVDEVVDVLPTSHGLLIRTRDGRQVPVDCAVLCLGNLPPDPVDLPHYIGNPWRSGTASDLDPASTVLIIGTGLTMVDTVFSLADRGHRGGIVAVSRRGLLPRAQQAERSPAAWRLQADLPATCLGLLCGVRAEFDRAAHAGRPWQDVVQALRPRVQEIWQRLDYAERRRFLRHLQPWWDCHRHCLPPETAARLCALMWSGQLRVAAGQVTALLAGADGIEARIRRRGAAAEEVLRVARAINCSGPNTDYETSKDALVRNLLTRGQVRSDVHRLGLEVDRRCALVDRYGRASARLFALGPTTRGTFWEITAVPEIRRQCAAFAGELLAGPTFSTGPIMAAFQRRPADFPVRRPTEERSSKLH